ncbi:hypothetical protein CMALT394_180037 [Carnobacterium maltaromaticum]|nr:hypothetical protein CMALT394_180037 [Carnobacterium maltaromaticum]
MVGDNYVGSVNGLLSVEPEPFYAVGGSIRPYRYTRHPLHL